MAAFDTFWGLTGTGWTAVGSIVSAVSVFVLVVFNWRFIRFARKQADASIDQARIAKQSLDTLQKQILEEQDRDRHAALSVIHETSLQLISWRDHAKTEIRTQDNPVRLLPDDWNVLTSYISRRFPSYFEIVRVAGWNIKESESRLNQYLKTPFGHRSPNSSTSILFDSLMATLEQASTGLSQIEKELSSSELSPPKLLP